MSDLQHIPLNNLSVSVANVRRTDRKTDIETLAASIAAHGLLQNLTVTPIENDCFAVVAGGRRLAALNLLVKKGEMVKDCAIPCQVVTAEAAAETSLAENVQRVAMNVMDEVEAFAGLVETGLRSDDIARRFGSTLRHVEQRLALARLSPKIRAAYRKGDLNLDAARAFCITDDQRAQERVFKQLGKPITHPQSVRNALTQGRLPATDKLTKFVGLEAYEQAGGRIVRDLFEDGIVFLDDGDLVQRLAFEKAEALRETLLAEGWGWVEVQFGHGTIEGCASERLRATQRRLTPKERKELAAVEAKIDDLDAKLEDAEDDNHLWQDRDAAEAKLVALNEARTSWNRKLIAHAGALIAIDYNGRPIIARGLIKRADMKTLDKLRNRNAASTKMAANAEDDADAVADTGPHLSKALVARLTQARTRGLRSALALNPHAALALTVHVLMRRSASHLAVPGVNVATRPVPLDDDGSFERARIDHGEKAPEEDAVLLAACLGQPIEKLLETLAVLLAETLDFSHEGASSEAKRIQRMSDALAAALDLDMGAHWQADQDFFEKAPKTLTIAALEAAPSIVALSADERARKIAAFAKMRKTDLATAAVETLRETGWLPDLLITPTRAGAFAVTAEGESALTEAA